MVIQKVLGKKADFPGHLTVDIVSLEWFERGKKILHKKSASGREIVLKRINETTALEQDDVVFTDEQSIVVVDILACSVIRIQPKTMYAMAQVVYEIGNKHLPLFYQDDCLLVPFEKPLFQVLQAAGFEPIAETAKLLHTLKTTVAPHGHHSSNPSLFSRILQMTQNG